MCHVAFTGQACHIRRWIRQCDLCAQRKPGPGRGKSILQQTKISNPLSRIAIDILECPQSESGNTYLIVVCDYFTKWAEAYPVSNHTALTVADKLVTEFISRFGVPLEIHTDQGREFESIFFSRLCELLQINKTRTAPYRPQSDGLVERFNRTLLQMLTMYINKNHSDWDEQVPFLLMAYRSTMHESTGCSPNLLMLNRECFLPIDIIAGNPPVHYQTSCPIQYVEWLTYTMRKTYEYAFRNIEKGATLQKKFYDVGLKIRQYNPNEFVWRWYPPIAGLKLGLGWTGPYKILAKLSSVNYKIQRDPITKPIVVHVDDIKPYLGKGIPTAWQQSGSDIPSGVSGSDKADTAIPMVASEPYCSRYGLQVKPPDYYVS